MAALAPLPAARGRCRAAPPARRCAHAHVAGQGPPQRPPPAAGRSRRAGQGRHPAPGTRPPGPPPPRPPVPGGGAAGPRSRSRPRPLRTWWGSAPPPQQAGRLRRGRRCSAGRKARQPAAPPAATIFLLLLPPPAPPGPAPPAAPPSRVSAPAASLPRSRCLPAGAEPDGRGRCRPGAPAGGGGRRGSSAPGDSRRGGARPCGRGGPGPSPVTHPARSGAGCRCLGSSERGRPCRAPTCPSRLPWARAPQPWLAPGGRRLPPARRCEGGCAKAPYTHRSCQPALPVLHTWEEDAKTEV